MGRLQPQELSFTDTAPFRSDTSTVCPAPAAAVFAVLRDHRGWVKWVGAGVTSVEPTSDPDYGVGSTRTVTFWRVAKVDERFVGWEEPTLWAFTGTSFRPRIFTKLVERFETEELSDGSCRITYRIGCDFPLLLRPFAGPFLRRFIREAGAGLERLSAEAVRRWQ